MNTGMAVESRPVDPTPVDDGFAPLGRIPALDGLRAIAVVVVVLYHGAWFGLWGGFVGVDLFFVLSGFLITRLLADEHQRDRAISLKNFYIRRALRLLPAVFAMVGFVWLFAALADAPRLEDRLASRSLWALSYVANWRDVVTGTHGGPFAHLWSLSVEEQFYVVWPVVVVALLRWKGLDAVRRLAGGLSLVLAAITAVRYWNGTDGFRLYFGTESHGAILLLAGSWLGASPRRLASLAPELARIMLWAGLAGFLVFCFAEDRFNVVHLGFGYLPITAISLMAVVGAVHHPHLAILTWGPMQVIGRWSYGIYLWHIPMFGTTEALFPDVDPMVRIIGGTIVATWLSAVLIERPALRLKSRWA